MYEVTITMAAGCSISRPRASTYVTPVARARGVQVDLHDVAQRPQLEVAGLLGDREHRHLRDGLGAELAREDLAVTAVHARREARAVRVHVAPAHVRRRRRVRVVAERRRGLLEERARVAGLHRGVRVLVAARSLERVPAGLGLAAQIARLPGDAARALEAVVVGLELVIGDAPILRRAVGRKRARAVASERATPRLEVPRQEAERLAVPVRSEER